MEKLTLKKKIKVLEHAFAASAGAYYSINLTQNLVPGKMYQVINDQEYSINEQIGMPDNAAFSDVVNYWGSKLEENEKKEYFEFLKISNLLKHYDNGEKHVWHRYWTRTALFEPMLAEQHIIMFEDEENGDVLAITYVLDQTEEFRKHQYSQLLEQKNAELQKMLEIERNYSDIMSGLSKIYWQIYSIDLKADTYIEVFNGWEIKNEHLCQQDQAQKGSGTTFIITLPFEIAKKPENIADPEENTDIAGLKLLLVEDNKLNAEIAEIILKDRGAEVTTVTDGLQAVHTFENCEKGSFDVILMNTMFFFEKIY